MKAHNTAQTRHSVRTLAAAIAIALGLSAGLAQADDATAKKLYEQALNDQYSKRNPTDAGKIKAAIATLEQAEGQAESAELKYDILVLESRSWFYLGEHTSGNNAKKSIFETGYKKAEQAKQLGIAKLGDAYAEAYYYYGINLGQWATANGVVVSLFRKRELLEHIDGAASRKTRTGRPGDTIDSYGPARVMGRILLKLPEIAGGSQPRAVETLRNAWAKAPENALNGVYLAEALLDGDSAKEIAEARSVLEDLLNPAHKYAEDRAPETQEELKQAQELLNSIPKN